jgi:hypothetical protein
MVRLRKFLWLGLLLGLAGCRQDMQDQPRFKPLAMNSFYPLHGKNRRESRRLYAVPDH